MGRKKPKQFRKRKKLETHDATIKIYYKAQQSEQGGGDERMVN